MAYHTQPKTASANVVEGTGVMYGIEIKTDGTNDVTLNVYDNTVASGVRLLTSDIPILGLSDLVMIEINRNFRTGVYVEATSSGSFSYIVEYIS